MSTSSVEHRQKAASRGPVPIAVVTVSDSRTEPDDVNGRFLRERIEAAGHRVVGYRIVKDDPTLVVAVARELAAPDKARIVLFNGGTGISNRDSTFEALSRLLEKTLPGFGELFRMLSWDEVGSAAMLSRATAGTFNGSVLISTPGSPSAVRLAWDKLIEPELEHLAWELTR